MAVTKEKKKQLIDEFKVSPKDTGSSALQVALLTERIQNLSEHFKKASKDYASRQGLLKMVSQRRRLLSYLKKMDLERYQKVIQRLDLRK